jgi:uroporphyrin-III C-methyltransferase / precorrin-2 dehydrogenase / sirohydrochlorin ferrochelatase
LAGSFRKPIKALKNNQLRLRHYKTSFTYMPWEQGPGNNMCRKSIMNRFPAFIDLQVRKTVIIGGGAAALGKARLVIAAGAEPLVIWPQIEAATRDELIDSARLIETPPVRADLAGAALVFVAVDDAAEAERWAGLARAAGALVNVVDRPELCDFTTPSIIDRGRLTIAVSSDGAAPVLVKKLRADIEALLPANAGALAEFAGRYRSAVKAKLDETRRRGFWEAFFNGPIAALVLQGDERAAHEVMLDIINRPQAEQEGVVHIVGAGPGDPDLLTIKALRLLQNADVILYDRLVSDEILSLARRDADRLYVGKAKAAHAVAQADIEKTMIALAREGKNVVRLKGGDPFVFGRGGEELDAMRAAGVAVFVTPGITAATGCAAAAGMALTHRDYAQAVTFVTGHAKGDAEPDLDWAALAALKNTLVVYMGVTTAEKISSQLIAHGRGPETPVAIIENGARANQKIIKGALADISALIEAGDITGPALLVIGEVAALADGETLLGLAAEQRRVA